jgi:hypothetical protein
LACPGGLDLPGDGLLIGPPDSMRDNRAFAARTAARFLRDGRLENCVNKQFLVPKV